MSRGVLIREKGHTLRKSNGSRCLVKYKKRKQVRRACEHCRRSKTACSSFRPCRRCIKHNMADQCVDAPRKGSCGSSAAAPCRERTAIGTKAGIPRTMPKALATCHQHYVQDLSLTPADCTLSVPSPEREMALDIDDDCLAVEADCIRNEPAPPKELWNYLEKIISKESLTDQDHEMLWTTLSDESNDAVVPDASTASPAGSPSYESPGSTSRLSLFSPSFEEGIFLSSDSFDGDEFYEPLKMVAGGITPAASVTPTALGASAL